MIELRTNDEIVTDAWIKARGLHATGMQLVYDALVFLIAKRSVDGLNGRTWDASAHLHFEDKVTETLDRIGKPSKEAN